MFALLRNLYRYLKTKDERKLVLVLTGLDNAGKTTLLAALRGELPTNTTPTWGFNTEKMESEHYKIDLYDLGGGKNIRKIWSRYYAEVHGCIFVVDAADTPRMEEAKQVLHEMLADPLMSGKPLLIFANKQDLLKALKAGEVSAQLDLPSLGNRRYQIIESIAKPAENSTEIDKRVAQGLKWLLESIEKDFAELGPRVDKDAETARQEEVRKMDERKKRVEAQKAERLREQEEAERAAAAATASTSQGAAEPHAASRGEGLAAQAGAATESRGGSVQVQQRPHPPPAALIVPPDRGTGQPSPSGANPIYGMPPGQIESPAKL